MCDRVCVCACACACSALACMRYCVHALGEYVFVYATACYHVPMCMSALGYVSVCEELHVLTSKDEG